MSDEEFCIKSTLNYNDANDNINMRRDLHVQTTVWCRLHDNLKLNSYQNEIYRILYNPKKHHEKSRRRHLQPLLALLTSKTLQSMLLLIILNRGVDHA